MTSTVEGIVGPQAPNTSRLDGTSSQATGRDYGLAELFSWDDGAGADFAAEVESVSRLFPHLDGLPSELTGDGAPGVAEQAAVCGGTRVALGAGVSEETAGSPADRPLPSPGDQCLMSPSDALAASPDASLAPLLSQPEPTSAGDWKVAPGGLQLSEMIHIPAENTVTDKITTLIDFVEPARAVATQPPPMEEIFVSPTDLEPNSAITLETMSAQNIAISDGPHTALPESPAAPLADTSDSTAAAGSHPAEFVQSSVIEFLAAETQQDEDHALMIDQGLEYLKVLEKMCGITPDETDPAVTAAAAAAGGSSESSEASQAGEVTAVEAVTPSISASPANEPAAAADTEGQITIKQEQQDEIEIVEERPAPRRRPPRVAVTPASAAAPAPAPVAAVPTTQLLIVLNSEQLAAIQKTGQLVLSATTLQPTQAATEASTADARSTSKAQAARRARSRAQAAGRVPGSASQTAVRPPAVARARSGAKSVTVVKPTSTVTSTVTSSEAGTSTSCGADTAPRKAVKRAPVIVRQEAAKRAKRTVKRPASSKDPLAGWMEQKLPPAGAGWEFPLPSQALEHDLPLPADGDGIPEDLQEVLLDSTDAGAVPSLPTDAADILEELISGSVRENPGLFDGMEQPEEALKPLAVCPSPAVPTLMEQRQPQQPASAASPQPLLLAPTPAGFSLSPQPQQQLVLESWVPTLCPSPPGESPVSPASECCSPELAPAPDWQPSPAGRRAVRRPRPYDKPAAGRGGARRQPLTEEERRERKKEQNKNAATRYRQKKKEEHDLVSGDQEMLEARNKVLRDRVGALSRELSYLKQLMREVLRHKQVSA